MKPPKSALLVPSLLLAAVATRAEIIERVIAKVNGDIVTLSDFEARQLAAAQAARIASDKVEAFLRENNARILQDAIDELLLVQRAAELGIKVRPEAVHGVIEGIKKENHIESEEQFQEALRQEGLSLDDIKRNVERSILRQEVLQKELQPKLALTEADARAEYEAKRAEHTRPATVHLQEILVKTEEGKDGSALAREIVARARAGEDFATLARTYSASPTRGSGGDLGRVEPRDMSPEISTAAAALKVGAVSDPMASGEGFRILKLLERTETSVIPFEDVKADITRRLLQQRQAREYEDYIEGLRKSAIVDVMVREVPLQVSGPVGAPPRLEPPGAAPGGEKAAPAPEPEITTTPQAQPERMAPSPSPTPFPKPTPPPA